MYSYVWRSLYKKKKRPDVVVVLILLIHHQKKWRHAYVRRSDTFVRRVINKKERSDVPVFYKNIEKRQLWVQPMGGWNSTLQVAWYVRHAHWARFLFVWSSERHEDPSAKKKRSDTFVRRFISEKNGRMCLYEDPGCISEILLLVVQPSDRHQQPPATTRPSASVLAIDPAWEHSLLS